MAIKTQEVTLKIVYDDNELEGSPADWNWKNTLTVSHAKVNNAYIVAAVGSSSVEDASPDEAAELQGD